MEPATNVVPVAQHLTQGSASSQAEGAYDFARDVHENREVAAFSYVWAMSVVSFFLKRTSPFVRFHALQGMLFFFISLIGFLLGFWFPPLNKLIQTAVVFFSVCGFILAYAGKKAEVPLLGSMVHGTFHIKGWFNRFKQDLSLVKTVAGDAFVSENSNERIKRELQQIKRYEIEQAYNEGLQASVSDFEDIEKKVDEEMMTDPELRRAVAYEQAARKLNEEKYGKDRYVRYANNISIDWRSKDRLNNVAASALFDEHGNPKEHVPWKES